MLVSSIRAEAYGTKNSGQKKKAPRKISKHKKRKKRTEPNAQKSNGSMYTIRATEKFVYNPPNLHSS
jgi:hypothetical protein